MPTENTLENILKNGYQRLDMETGIISRIVGESYTIVCVVSELGIFESGAQFELKDTYCSEVIKKRTVVTYREVGSIDAMVHHPVYVAVQIESYIGVPLFVNNQLFGTLNFSAVEPRSQNFTRQEIDFVENLALEVGTLLAEAS